MLKSVYLILFAVLLTFDASAQSSKKAPQELPAKLLKHYKCKQRKNDNISYCVDKDNKKVTAELRKYEDGKMLLSIPVINSLIDGTVKSYDLSGNLEYEKTYSKGKLNGPSTTYFPNKFIEKQIPYSNGLKEGVAKYYYQEGTMHTQCTYVNDKLDGKLKTYTKDKEVLYDIVTAQDKFLEGTCQYLGQNNQIESQKIPEILLDAVNNRCIAFGTELSKKCCSIDKNDILSECNKEWLKENIETLREYLKKCEQ